MSQRVLIHAHVFYPEMWEELADCIANVDLPFDLFVTTVCDIPELTEKIERRFANAKMIVCENKGFDIAPFFKVLNGVDLDDYAYIVKLHSKRDFPFTMFINGKDVCGTTWRDLLLSPLKSKENWQKTKDLLASSGTGMVAEGCLILNNLRDKTPRVFKKVKKHVCDLGLKPASTDFVAGTMFVGKAELFKCFQNKENFFDFSDSVRGQGDGLPYVCERLLGAVVSAQGCEIKALHDDMSIVKKRWFFSLITHFFFMKKVSSKKTLVKICKIPVFSRKREK